MKKYLLLLVAAILIVPGLFFAIAFAQEKPGTPEATVRAFYVWYIKRDSQSHGFTPLDDEIYRYVSKGTVDLLRQEYKSNEFPDADYFTNTQDYDEKDWLAHIKVRSLAMVDDVALVSVTLGKETKTTVKTNIVFLRQQNGAWKIIRVVDTRGYQ